MTTPTKDTPQTPLLFRAKAATRGRQHKGGQAPGRCDAGARRRSKQTHCQPHSCRALAALSCQRQRSSAPRRQLLQTKLLHTNQPTPAGDKTRRRPEQSKPTAQEDSHLYVSRHAPAQAICQLAHIHVLFQQTVPHTRFKESSKQQTIQTATADTPHTHIAGMQVLGRL